MHDHHAAERMLGPSGLAWTVLRATTSVASLFILAALVAGCRPAVPGPTGRAECFRLDATPTVPNLLPLTLTVRVPRLDGPPPHGGRMADGTWSSDREVYGVRRGTAQLSWTDGGLFSLALLPVPTDVGVRFEGQTDYTDTDGGVAVTGWSGAWIVSGEEPVADTRGTFVMTRRPGGWRCW